MCGVSSTMNLLLTVLVLIQTRIPAPRPFFQRCGTCQLEMDLENFRIPRGKARNPKTSLRQSRDVCLSFLGSCFGLPAKVNMRSDEQNANFLLNGLAFTGASFHSNSIHSLTHFRSRNT